MECFTPKLLIITMHSGENELEECKSSLKMQTFQNFRHEIISGLENRAAHQKLYARCMEESANFNYFLKLDADMVLSNKDALHFIINTAMRNPDADLIAFTVFDFYTDSPIWGINLFSNRATWSPVKEGLFVDEQPAFPGRKLKVFDYPNPHVLHSPNPSPYQAFVFGLHRALKVVQFDRRVPLLGHSYIQLKTINALWKKQKKVRDLRLTFALTGTAAVFNKKVNEIVLVNKNEYTDLFENVCLNQGDRALQLPAHFDKIHLFLWIRMLGFYRFVLGAILYLKKKL